MVPATLAYLSAALLQFKYALLQHRCMALLPWFKKHLMAQLAATSCSLHCAIKYWISTPKDPSNVLWTGGHLILQEHLLHMKHSIVIASPTWILASIKCCAPSVVQPLLLIINAASWVSQQSLLGQCQHRQAPSCQQHNFLFFCILKIYPLLFLFDSHSFLLLPMTGIAHSTHDCLPAGAPQADICNNHLYSCTSQMLLSLLLLVHLQIPVTSVLNCDKEPDPQPSSI